MPTLSVLVSHGVYNVFIDMSTMQPVSFSCKEEIPDMSTPYSFNSIDHLKHTFPDYELKLVGEVAQDSQNIVSNAPTFEELRLVWRKPREALPAPPARVHLEELFPVIMGSPWPVRHFRLGDPWQAGPRQMEGIHFARARVRGRIRHVSPIEPVQIPKTRNPKTHRHMVA